MGLWSGEVKGRKDGSQILEVTLEGKLLKASDVD